ncbi:MAG: GAF domain-containing protein [Verrucomicrobia bacterium]|nr:GAF domain-containing protein [Verrucomicrobiota bacterium]
MPPRHSRTPSARRPGTARPGTASKPSRPRRRKPGSRFDRLNLLYRVSDVLHATLNPQEALQGIVRESVRAMGASSGSLALVNPTNGLLEIQACEGLPARAGDLKLRVGEGITGWVVRTGQAARVGDVRADPRYVMVRPEVRSEMAVPLGMHGDVSGVINVDSERAEAFSEEDLELLTELARQASRVIQNTWLYEQLRRKARLFESLVSVGQAISSTVGLDDVLGVITREACQLMNSRMCSLFLVDDAGSGLELRAHHGAGAAYRLKPPLSVAESLMGTVVRRKKPLQVENVQTDPRYQHADVARQEGLVSLLSVPLLFNADAIGTVNVYTGTAHVFSNEEIRILSALAALSAIAIEKARLYERIVDMEELLRQNERLSALGLLAAEVAHEVRNPLTVMKLLYHSLDLQFAPDDPRARDARVISEKMDHLNRIVERILDFARSNEPELRPVDINQVLDEMSLLVRHKLNHQQVTLVRQLAHGLPPVMADAGLLAQAFLNLVLNAVQAMPRGGRLTVTTRAVPTTRPHSTPSRVAVEFEDTGEGMRQDRQHQVFGSLLKTTRTRGTGLGLAIVRRVLEAHRGNLEIHSRPGQGTLIRLLLPAQ